MSITSGSEWQAGTLTSTSSDIKEGEIQLTPSGSWGAQSWRTPDKTIGVGSAFASDGEHIYVARGYADVTFWRYHPPTDTWETLANLPRGAYYGADLQYLDGNVYAIFGGYQKAFYRYDIDANAWEQLTDFPNFPWQGAAMASDNLYIYAIPGNTTQEFYRYNPSTDTWTTLASAPNTLRSGADLTHINGYIYTPRGVNTTTMYRYQISTNTWSAIENVPATLNDDIDTTTDGTDLYVAKQQSTTLFYRYNVASDTWTTLTSAPYNSQYAGVQFFAGDGHIYFFRGINDYRFWKYDIATDSFIGPAESPATLSTGSNWVYYNQKMYVLRGSNTTTYYSYQPSNNTWTTLEPAPSSFNDDTNGVVVGSLIYYLGANNNSFFYSYNPSSNTWNTLENTPLSTRYSPGLAYPGTGDYIYATRGQNTSTFWRYKISTDEWQTTLDNLPGSPTIANLPTGVTAHIGSQLIANATDVFFLSGNGIKRLFKYSINDNSWTELANPPFLPYYGTDITINGDRITALAGNYKNDIYQYSITENVWRKLPVMPGYGPNELGAWGGASITYDPIGNQYFVTRGNSRQEVLVFAPNTSNYPASGTWQSQILDLMYVQTWTSLVSELQTPDDSAVTIETRTSQNNIEWESWQEVTGDTIISTPQRYLQIRATLQASADLTHTPTLSKLELTYIGDSTPPTNPSTADGFSQVVAGQELTDGGSYRFLNPYFTWSPAIDSETSIAGYYVYFGANANANPEDDGVYLTSTNYQANTTLTTGPHYLRIVSENMIGLKSEPETIFVYDYNGISPPSTVSATQTTDFSGTATNIITDDNQLVLEGLDEGFWQQEQLSTTGTNIQYGGRNAAYISSTNSLYVVTGANNTVFKRYDISTDTWTSLATTPANTYYGSSVVEGPDGSLYALRGTNTTDFWRYDLDTDTWHTDVASAPLTISYGSSMVFDGVQYIYVTRGNNTDTFWRYDTFADEWNTLDGVDFGVPSQAISNNINRSADLAIDRVNGYIYATQGNFLAGFSQYDINTGNWTILPNTPNLPYDGSSIEYDPNTSSVFMLAGYSSTDFYRFDIETQSWLQLPESPIAMPYGAGLNLVDNSLYVIRGGNTQSFYRYDIEEQSWQLPNRGLFGRVYAQVAAANININTGADIILGDDDNFYITRGGTSDDFIRYNYITGQVTRLENTPSGITTGSSLLYAPNQDRIYLTAGVNDLRFYWYDINTNTWYWEDQDPLPAVANSGSSMVFDGTQYIYLNRGGNSAIFYRYDTLATAGSRWSTLTNAPATLSNGAELVIKNDYIYTLRGNNAVDNPLYRYDIDKNSWSTMANLAVTVQTDGFLLDGGGDYLYATRGLNQPDFYRYTISTDTWEKLGNAPALISTGAAGDSNRADQILMLPGANTANYQDALYTYVQKTSNSGFTSTGSYVSQIYDLNNVYKWGPLLVEQTLPQNTSISIYTRSSLDQNSWSDWTAVSLPQQSETYTSYKINSAINRYLQLKIELGSGDNLYSPTVSGYSFSYYQDTLAPSNPESVSPELNGFMAYTTASKSATLNYCTFTTCPEVVTDPDEWYWTQDWYNYTNPHFEWPLAELPYGATDTSTGSGVQGYYVYFGTNSVADPAIDGQLQIENSFTAESLSDNSIHYLRIKTVDQAGNVSPEAWTPLSYRFDSEGPLPPLNVTADPAGYSANPLYSFSWETASSSGALISDYCYKTATNSGVFASDQCVPSSTLSITDVPQYKVGQNTFSVRARDQADNYSEYASVSYFFADVANAPAPPTNLTVSPESSTQNSFAFTWSPPDVYLGAAANIKYHYSVNALPTEQSTSETSLTYLNAGAYATLPGENTFYVVAQDEAGNINYSNYASIVFSANTVAPGIPVNMEIADVSVKAQSSWRLAISWDEPVDAGSGVASYKVYRSIDGSEYSFLATTSGNSYVDTKLEKILYYYYIKACDNTNNCGAESTIVSLLPDGRYTEPAELVAPPVISSITTKKATVTWTTARTADSRISYGVSSGEYFDTEVASSEQVANHILDLINLDPGTNYYLVAKWTDEDGNTGTSEEVSFETLPPPSTEEPTAKNIGLTSAMIEFVSKNSAKIKLYYGETSAFGGVKEISTGSGEGTYNIELSELKDGTKYYYKINAFDVDGTEYEGEMHSFTTLPRPRVGNISITQVQGAAQTTILVRWMSNTAVSSIVTYFPTNKPQLAKDEVNIALKEGAHRAILVGLEPQTAYTLVIRGKDIAGNEAVSPIQQLTTASDSRPPQISDLKVDIEIIGTGEEASTQLIVSFGTDEPATSQIEYGEGTGDSYPQKTQEDATLVSKHLVVISGLSPGKVYHLRALAKDEARNLGESIDKVVVAPKAADSALDLVITNLGSVFSFLRTF